MPRDDFKTITIERGRCYVDSGQALEIDGVPAFYEQVLDPSRGPWFNHSSQQDFALLGQSSSITAQRHGVWINGDTGFLVGVPIASRLTYGPSSDESPDFLSGSNYIYTWSKYQDRDGNTLTVHWYIWEKDSKFIWVISGEGSPQLEQASYVVLSASVTANIYFAQIELSADLSCGIAFLVDVSFLKIQELSCDFNSAALVNVEHLSKSFLILAELEGGVQSGADLEYANIDLYAEFNIFAEASGAISFELLALSAEASAQAQASADCGNAVLFLNAFFYGVGTVSSPVRTALGRGDWRRVVSLGVDSGALNIEREQWRAEGRGGWGVQQHVVRNRDLCPEIGEEVADAVYQAGGFFGPSNEIPEAAPVGNRGRIPAPSGQWFAVSRVRPVRHVDWEYCEGRAERCEIVPSEWRHSPSLVPYPHLFLQTNVNGSGCSPVNRLRNGVGPAMWIAHFRGQSIPDWKLIAAIILKPDQFYAIAIMAVGPMGNAVSEWGPWEPSESGICNGVEFIQRSFDINKVRRPKLRKAIGTSLEECEYGLPWFDGVYDIKNWEMLVFDGRTTGRALWFNENEASASALYLPVGENGASVFIG